MSQNEIRRSIWINAPRERVWLAVTEPAQITQWFAPGAELIIKDSIVSMLMGGEYVELAFIETFDPPHQFTTLGLPERAIATTYLLEEEQGGTRFTVIESGLETLPDDARQKHIEQNSAGWDMALQNLQAYVDGKSLPRPEGF